MKKLFSFVICLFLSASSISASMEEWGGTGKEATRLTQSEGGNVLETQPGVEGLPEGFDPMTATPLKGLTPAQKIGCCVVACLPCLCAVSCFNHITSWINQGTCGLFYQGCPCLNCTD